MLVRNLRKAGDYERAILSQEENLRMAIANDRNVAQARSQFSKGMIPELTPQQMRSKEEELTDIIAIQAKAQENLLTLYPIETVRKFMEGLTQESMTYLNVYWNDLKPILKNKTGLNKTFFDRILKKHIDGIVDSRGMSVVPTTGTKSVSLNELDEVKRLGFDWMLGSPVLTSVLRRLRDIANSSAAGGKAAHDVATLEDFIRFLPKKATLDKANNLPEGRRGDWYNRLIKVFEGTDPVKENWDTLNVKQGREFLQDVARHYTIIDEAKKDELANLYSFVGFE
jgi:hypothetical protein